MTPTRTLTPERILNLFRTVREEGPRLGEFIRDTLSVCAESREQCRHLLPLFEGGRHAGVTYWDVYLAHYRWAGRRQWSEWEEELMAEGAEALPTHLENRLEKASTALRWGLVEGLCETSRRLARSDRSAAEAVARHAVRLARKVPLDVVDPQCRQELLALACATLANAYRAQDRVQKARATMDRAQSALDSAPSRPLGLTAAFLSLRATLESWERHYLNCLDTLDEALGLQPADPVRARLLIQRANQKIIQERAMEGAEDLQEALSALDPAKEPHLWFCAAQNHLWVLTELGRVDEAEELLPEVERMAQVAGGPAEKLRVRWVKARLAENQDRPPEAQTLYAEVRVGFLDCGLPYGAAVVTLDLARLLLHQGSLEEVKTHVLSTLAEFQRQQVKPEFISALALLKEALLAERLTVEVLGKARELIEQRKGSPG